MSNYNFKDITGQRFGKLTAIRRAENKGKLTYWICICDCDGNEKAYRTIDLRAGKINSCGCNRYKFNAEFNKQTKKKYNKYNLLGEYGIGYTDKGEEFYFNFDDYEKIKDYYWYMDKNKYLVSENYIDGKRKGIKQHRIIVNAQNYDVVDHINHITYDNRKENLRICTQHKNTFNQTISSNNTSGYKGVYWDKCHNKWVASIQVDKKQKHLGYFSNIDDAVKIRKEAEIKYYGEFRYKGEN